MVLPETVKTGQPVYDKKHLRTILRAPLRARCNTERKKAEKPALLRPFRFRQLLPDSQHYYSE